MDRILLQSATEVAVIFDNVANYQELVAAFRPGIEVHVLDSGKDGLEQMAGILDGRSGISALHVVGHGSAGSLNLGAVTIDAQNVGAYGGVLGRIAASLSTGGDILLYGCDVASGAIGARFVGQIAQVTGKDVAASTDPTGGMQLGGDWALEYRTGFVTADGALDASAVRSLDTLLALEKNVTDSSQKAPGTFVPGFTLTSSLGIVGDSDPGVDGIYVDSGAKTATFNIAADGTSVGTFDLTGMTFLKLLDEYPHFRITIIGHKANGGTPTASIEFAMNSTTPTSPDDFGDMTGLTSFDVTITVVTVEGGGAWDLTLDAFTVDNVTAPAPGTPDLKTASDTGTSTTDNITSANSIDFSGTGADGASVSVFIDKNNNGVYDSGTDIRGTGTVSGGAWTVSGLSTTSFADGTYKVYAQQTVNGVSSALSTALDLTIDRTAPALFITSSKSTLKTGDTAIITFTFTEDPGTSFSWDGSSGDIVATGGTLSAISGTGTTRTATFTPTSNTNTGTASITVASGAYADAAGNNGGAGTTPSITFDTKTPALTITSDKAALAAGESATITFTFSEDPGASFSWNGTTGDVTVTGGTLSAISGAGTTRTAIFTPTANTNSGTASITVASGAYTDAAGNNGGDGTSPSITFDTLAPTVTITSNKSTVRADDTATITFTFSEDPGSTFTWDGTSGDVTVTGGTLSAISGTGNTRTATFTPTANTNSGTASITVASGSYVDAAGNAGGAGASPGLTFDTKTPTSTITMADTSLTAGESTFVTFQFSEAVINMNKVFVTVEGGTLSDVSTNNGGVTWTGIFTPTADITDTTNVITLDNSALLDAANNPGTGTTQSDNYEIRTVRPTASIVVADTNLKIGETSLVTITFSEPVTGFDNDDLTVAGGTLGEVTSADGGTTWTATFTPTAGIADTTNIIALTNSGFLGESGNIGIGTTNSNNYAIDTAAPAATVGLGDSALTVGETTQVTITFSEAVSGFDNTDLVVEGGSMSAVSTSDGGKTWTATFTPTTGLTDTTNAITLDLSGVQDLSDNPGSGTVVSDNYSIDTQRPTATSITLGSYAIKAGETTTVTIVFPEVVTGFTAADLNVQAGAIEGLSSIDGKTWTATFRPIPGVNAPSNVISLSNAGVADSAGNAGEGVTTSDNYAVNTMRPWLSSIHLNDTALTAGETSVIDFRFSEKVFGLTLDDITADGGTLSDLVTSDDGTNWSVTYTPNPDTERASNRVSINTAGVTNAAGNSGSNTLSSPSFAVDSKRPTATIAVADDSLAIGETSLVTITFNEQVSGLTDADLTVENGSLEGLSTADGGRTWTATLRPTANLTDTTNVITLNNTGVTDGAGNAGTGTSTSNNYVIDSVRPTATISLNDDMLAAGETATVTVQFSEAVTGFTKDDLTAANGTLGAMSSEDGGITWTGTFTPTDGIADSTNVITLDNTGVADLAGNAGSGTTGSGNYVVQTVRPTATIVVAQTALKAGETAQVTISFSEAVSGLTADDLTVANGTISTPASSDGGITWTAILTPSSDVTATTNVITLANTGVVNGAGNAGSGTTTSNNYQIDTLAPTVTISSDLPSLKIGQTATITFTFSEDPGSSFTWDGSSGDVIVSGGTLSAIAGTGLTRTATFTPDENTNAGTASITIASGAYTDAAGNHGGAGATPSLSFDTLAPAAPSAPDLAAGSDGGSSDTDNLTADTTPTFTGTAENGATVTLYDSDGTTVLGTGTATGGNWSITTTALSTGSHTITAKATDTAGNTSSVSASLAVTVDTTGPATTIGGIAISADSGASTTDFVTRTAVQSVTATLSAGLAAGEILYGSADGGGTWTDITGKVSGTTINWSGVTLAGSSSLKLKLTDAAGNDGPVATQAYILDTEGPVTTIASVAFSADTGVSDNDFVTVTAAQTISGELSANLAAGETVYVSLDNGATWAAAAASVGHDTWSLAGQTLPGSNTLKVKVTDAAGNDGTTATQAYALDTAAPVIQTASANGSTLTLTYTDGSALDAVNKAATSAFKVFVNNAEIAVNTVTVDANAKTVTLALASAVQYGQTVKLDFTDPGGDTAATIQDAAGNDAASLTDHAVTNNTAAPPPPAPSVPPPTTGNVDGVQVQTQTTTNPDGSTSQTVTIPVVTPTRQEQVGDNSVADIPIVKTSTGGSLLTAQVPTGVGLQISGTSAPKAAGSSVNDLIREIKSRTGEGSSDQDQLTGGGSGFLQNLPSDAPLLVQTIVPTVASNTTTPSEPLVITGTPEGSGNPATALVIDTRGLPSGTVIQLQNVEFAAVIGAVRVTGGAGSQSVWGDSSGQYIVLGADDDELHGGAGDDTVGSEGGNDRLFGDEGNDTLFGGAGQDLILGGAGNDTVTYALNQADYTVERSGKIITVRSRADVADADTLVNVESIRFADGTLAVADGNAPASTSQLVAGLYAVLFERAPDIEGLQYWLAQAGNGHASLREIASSFAAVAKFEEVYAPSLSNAGFVDAIYQNILGIAGDAQGRAYWTARIEAGLDRTDFVADFVTAALNFDVQAATVSGAELANAVMAHEALGNKVQVGLHFAAALGSKSNGAVDSQAYLRSVEVLAGVNDDSASVENAVVRIDLVGGHTGFGSAVAEGAIFS